MTLGDLLYLIAWLKASSTEKKLNKDCLPICKIFVLKVSFYLKDFGEELIWGNLEMLGPAGLIKLLILGAGKMKRQGMQFINIYLLLWLIWKNLSQNI